MGLGYDLSPGFPFNSRDFSPRLTDIIYHVSVTLSLTARVGSSRPPL